MRVRIRFSKLGKVRWTSHRDVARMWERAFRRVGLPVAYTSGFSPRPKVSFGLALPTGHESVAEYLDVELATTTPGPGEAAGSPDRGGDPAVLDPAVLDPAVLDPAVSDPATLDPATLDPATLDPVALDPVALDLAALPARLSDALPHGVDALAAVAIGPGTPSLQEDVSVSTWRWAAVAAEGADAIVGDAIVGDAFVGHVAASVDALLAAASAVVPRHRKGTEVFEDIRPAILSLRVTDGVITDAGAPPSADAGTVWLEADLASQPRSIRPSDVLAALGPGFEERDVRRLHQWIWRDGARWEPVDLPADATCAPHVSRRAS